MGSCRRGGAILAVAALAAAASGGAARADEASAPPAGGDARGPTRRFEKLGLSWTLPAGETGVGSWVFLGGDPGLGPTDSGWIATVEYASDDGLKHVEAELAVRPYETGQPLAAFLEKGARTDPIAGVLDGFPEPTVVKGTTVGNAHGGALTVSGKAKDGARKAPGQPLEVRAYFVLAKGVAYQLNVFLRGEPGRHAAQARAALDGLEWEGLVESAWGPVASPFEMHSEPRGDLLDKDVEVKVTKAHGFRVTKPKGWRLWRIDGANPTFHYFDRQVWWFAAEARTDRAYCLFTVQTFPKTDLVKETPPKSEERLIDDFEKWWKTEFPDGVTRPRSKDANRESGAFKEGKGSTYEFRGSQGGTPYLERGWLVPYPKYVYWIRTQYGGPDAEATFAPAVQAMTKGFVYER
jgi:hypothetical protein